MSDKNGDKRSPGAGSMSKDPLHVAERFVAALNTADVAAVREIYDPEVRIWYNFSGRTQNRDENIKTLLWLHRVLDEVNYDIQRREALPDGFMQQHVLRGMLSSGQPFMMPACVICRVRDGRIISLEEYIDSAQSKALVI